MSMPISVCNDTFKINNVVFLPTKDVKKENHTIWVLEYSDNAVFIVDASTWDEIDEVIKETMQLQLRFLSDWQCQVSERG